VTPPSPRQATSNGPLASRENGPLSNRDQQGKHLERIRANYDRPKDTRHFLALYDLETDRLYGRFTERKTGQVFLSFLKWVRRRYPIWQTLHVRVHSDQ
jgi:hypothetical protein